MQFSINHVPKKAQNQTNQQKKNNPPLPQKKPHTKKGGKSPKQTTTTPTPPQHAGSNFTSSHITLLLRSCFLKDKFLANDKALVMIL